MKYSQNFRKVIENAKKFSNGEIEPIHLYYGLLNVKDSSGYLLLSNIINVEEVENSIAVLLHLNDTDVDTINRSTEISKLSVDAESIMMQSQLESKKYGSEIIKTEHLVLAMVKSKLIEKVKYEDIEVLLKKINNMGNYQETPKENDKPNTSFSKKTKTPILDEFSTDLTKLAMEGKLDPVVGRSKEIRRIAQVLSRRKKNNPVLIGDPGVGKTAVIEGLAQSIIKKETPDTLHNKRVLALEMGSIVAGTKYRGEFEERMKKIVDELKQNPDIIIYIDELHTIVGAGGSTGSLDAANILKPALARGEISCIGSTTNDEYKKIEKDGALERRFQKVKISEPTYDETYEILMNLKGRYEDYHTVTYTDEAIKACLKLSEKYLTDRKFPDKAIDAMDEAGSSVRISMEQPIEIINKQKELDDITISKLKKVTEQDYQGAANDKKIQDELTIELEILKKDNHKNHNIRKPVTAIDVAEVISIMTGIPSKNISEDDTEKLINLSSNLKGKVIGQDQAVEVVSKSIIRNKAGISDDKKPIGVFLFTGPSGVGKTLLAKKLAETMFNSERDFIRIDMSEYMEKHSVSRLIGAPPGYVGHEDGGQLTDAIRNKPYSIVLLDEIEKAHQDVTNILLQVFDDGILTDNQGRVANFKNTIIIMTSNIGSKESKLRGGGIGFTTDKVTMNKSVIDNEIKKKFAPEFLNRIDEIIHFESLSKDNIKQIIDIELSGLIKKLNENGIQLELDDTAKDLIFEKGWNEELGARPLKRAIQKYIQDEISIKIIMKEIKSGDKIKIARSLGEDKLEFVNISSMLSLNPIDGTISDIIQ